MYPYHMQATLPISEDFFVSFSFRSEDTSLRTVQDFWSNDAKAVIRTPVYVPRKRVR